MNLQINQLVKSLLAKESLEQCSLQELEQYASRHPYFGAAQLLLTKKLQLENHEKFDEQLQKTYLFFHNPLWVQHLLNDTGNAEIILPAREEAPGEAPAEAIPVNTTEEQDLATVESIAVVVATPAPALSEESAVMEPATLPENPVEPASVPDAKEELVFEPYHTIDYFASQGIRFKEEEKPADKFGQQLRSFTDWLKTMKKLPVAEMAKTVEAVSEKKVVQLAEQSLSGGEVLTESMAEVWIKQGNPHKALEVYHKLSLLEPAKSAYFAAKIEELKKNS